jgi:hypothetical protein
MRSDISSLLRYVPANTMVPTRNRGIKGFLEQWFKRYVLEADPEEKIPLPYICPEAGGRWRRLNEFISGAELGSP